MTIDAIPTRLRIFHVEDEWQRWTSIPHHIFDRLFDGLQPRGRVDLEPFETWEHDTPNPYSFHALKDSKKKQAYFSYHFLLNAENIDLARPTQNDIFILDIMNTNAKGQLVSAVNPLLKQLRKYKFPIQERCRYFSAYPGELPPGTDFVGFSKGESHDLVDYIFGLMKPLVIARG
jgi:hypothetical protein